MKFASAIAVFIMAAALKTRGARSNNLCYNFDNLTPYSRITEAELSAMVPGVTFDNIGTGYDFFVAWPCDQFLYGAFTCGNAILTYPFGSFNKAVATFEDSPACEVSVTMGDRIFDSDKDLLYLIAYDEDDEEVDRDEKTHSSNLGEILSVDDPSCQISYVMFYGDGSNGRNSVFWDNFCFTVNDNTPPVAQCKDATLSAGPGCKATVASSDIDDRSYDPDDDGITLAVSPEGPFAAGTTNEVTLTVTDEFGATDSCTASVDVVDDEAPQVDCGSLGVIAPCETPVSGSFGAVAKTNGCPLSVATSHEKCQFCNGAGKIKDRDCDVETSGSVFTIIDAGGVQDHISFTVIATNDNSGSSGTLSDTKTCTICVQNPSVDFDPGCSDSLFDNKSNGYICEGDYPDKELECSASRLLRG